MTSPPATSGLPTADLRIRGGTVLTMVPGQPVTSADVYVTGEHIVAVGGPDRPARSELDARGMAVMPGTHDLHDHLRDLTPGARIGEGLKLEALLKEMWRLGELAGPDEYRVGAALGAARLLKAGVTSVVDHIYPFHRPGLAEAAIAGYQGSGIRWYLARGVMTQGYEPICETPAAAFAGIRELADGLVPKERLFVAPVSLRQASVEDYVAARQVAEELGLGMYTHIAETAAEVETTVARHGARPVELLHRLGFCGANSIFVHCVLLSDEEIAQLADSGTHVVHCPTNHMKLAKGVTPVPKLLESGVNVGLGVDMMDDVLTEARQEILLQGVHAGDPSVISTETALAMATRHGAVALGFGDEMGTVEVGKRADLVCVDLGRLGVQPVLDPAWSVVHRARSGDVAHVVVDGNVVVLDRRLVRVDESALVAEARDVIGSYLKRAGLEEGVLR